MEWILQPLVLRCFAILAFFCYNLQGFFYATKILPAFKHSWLHLAIPAALNTILIFFIQWLGLPYAAMYFFAYLCLIIEFIFLSKAAFSQAYFGASNFIVQIVCLEMVVVCILSLISGFEAASIRIVSSLFSLDIIFTSLLSSIALFLFNKFMPDTTVIKISHDREQSLLISIIASFIIIYTAIDSFVVMTPDLHENLVYTLLAIQILSITLFYILFIHTAKICHMKFYKDEAHSLECTLRESILTEEHLKRLIYKDNLTGCYSKNYVLEYLENLLRNKISDFCLVYLDLDGLKAVNDSFGHNRGDEYLLTVSQCIADSIRQMDIFARMGGDEFMLILEVCSKDNAEEIFSQIAKRLIQINNQNTDYSMSVSYGILYVDDTMISQSLTNLISMVDQKMYLAKQQKHAAMEKEV
ncbi:MAG: GGDEF domain-containing protein [Lachnospiraceae bacterium]